MSRTRLEVIALDVSLNTELTHYGTAMEAAEKAVREAARVADKADIGDGCIERAVLAHFGLTEPQEPTK